MSEFRNRERQQALVFISLGLLVCFLSYQNFEYPQHISKSKLDFNPTLNSSDLEIQKTRQMLGDVRAQKQLAKTRVIESEAPLKLKLKRAPAKTASSKKVKKKLKQKKKMKRPPGA